jgi:putative ABC transport system permease protein
MKQQSSDRPQPPRAGEWLLKRLYYDNGKHTHLGDFAEIYGEILAEKGRFRAVAWYWGQILRSLPGFVANKVYWSLSMLRNYAVISYRNAVKNPGFSLIALLGLAVGLACFILILAYVRFETSYDTFHEKSNRIYRIISTDSSPGMDSRVFQAYNADPLAAALRTDYPEVSHVARFYPFENKAVLKSEDRAFTQSGYFADRDFLEIFSFPLVRGDESAALAAPGSIVLSKTTAQKLFGDRDPIGQPISFRTRRGPADLNVSGVVEDVPRNSHLQFDFIISLASLEADKSKSYMFNNWKVWNFHMYVELTEAAAKKPLEEKLTAFIRKLKPETGESGFRFVLQPLGDIHLRSNIEGELSTNNEIRYIYLFLTIALLILLIAAINYMNLVTARSSTRAREIGIRKVTGANRRQLFQQFLGESVVFALLALVLALAIVRLAFPRFSAVAGADLRLADLAQGSFLLLIFGATLLTGIFSGAYPALVLSAFQPVRVLKELMASGKKGARLRNLLVVGQFTASIVLIISAVVVAKQLRFIRSQRLGFDREHVLVIPLRESEAVAKAGAIKTELLRHPEIESVSQTSALPTKIRSRMINQKLVNDQGETVEMDYHFDYVDEDFLKVFKIDLIAGRNFSPEDKNVVLINETMAKKVGWSDPLSRGISAMGDGDRIIGVVKDFYFDSFHSSLEPMVLFFERGDNLAVRIRSGNVMKTVALVKDVFERSARSQPWEFSFYDDDFNALYRKEQRTGEIFGAFAGLAVLIAGLGLLGLAAFAVERRTKEIGIRKVLGASAPHLAFRLSREFLGLVLAANVIAFPIAYFAMSRWLQDFAYRIGLTAWPFLLAAAGALVFAFLTVSTQTLRAASANPVETLRYE